ncbi:hypothetical protein [Alkalihalobacillus trypoxylicola]|uniref:Phosphoribulokinase/uridine kinase domain-containing protein n=1 Tax=Alkalihalobacillus trypoxylicola TaxID=519424 RepID=A0A161P6L0_9BACI|nr:hypothetical protein [Alkalihalobacillus trypoxylicola]KYG27717.1 hypothetical protein AZF04_11045 [Alkalihalobacillus trypoxylicola]
MNQKRPRVIALAAVSGGGKTTITSKLQRIFPNSKTLFFDDYDLEGPEDIIDWVDRGANREEWNLTPFLKDLENLISEPLDYLFLDYPFAYTHNEVSDYLDYTIFIDTPLDIAMARRIMRDFSQSSSEDILLDMKNYLLKGRRGYLDMLVSTKPNSDFIVDGSLPIDEIVENIRQQLIALSL